MANALRYSVQVRDVTARGRWRTVARTMTPGQANAVAQLHDCARRILDGRAVFLEWPARETPRPRLAADAKCCDVCGIVYDGFGYPRGTHYQGCGRATAGDTFVDRATGVSVGVGE